MIISESRMKMNVEMLFYSDNLLIHCVYKPFFGHGRPRYRGKSGATQFRSLPDKVEYGFEKCRIPDGNMVKKSLI